MKTNETPYQQELILLIKKMRQDKGISQSQLSEILGLSPGQIGNIESPKFTHKYTLKQIHEISKYFNYPIEKIFFQEEEIPTTQRELIDGLINKIIDYDK